MPKVLDYDFERPWWSNPVVTGIAGGVAFGGGSYVATRNPETSGIIGLVGSIVSGGATYVLTRDKVFDASEFGNDGILRNGAHIKEGELSLDGEDDYVSVPHDPVLNLDSLTIRARVLPRKRNAYTFIWGPKWGFPYSFFVRENNQMVLQFRRNGEPHRLASDWRLPEAGDWYDLGVSRNSETGEVKFYVGGELDSTKSAPSGPIENVERPFFIGRGGGDMYSELSMDWLRIHNRPGMI